MSDDAWPPDVDPHNQQINGNYYRGHHYDHTHVGPDGRAILGDVGEPASRTSAPLWPYFAAGAGVFGSAFVIAITRSNGSSPSPGETGNARLPASLPLPKKTPQDLYREAAYSLLKARDEIQAWDTNGMNSRRPESRRVGFLEDVMSVYVAHFRRHGLDQLPHILIINDNINIDGTVLVDAVNFAGDVVAGASLARYTHHKMAAWRISANHFGFNVYIFREGKVRHGGLHPGGGDNGGKGFGNWMWYPDPERKLWHRQPLGPQARDPGHQNELVTFRTPW